MTYMKNYPITRQSSTCTKTPAGISVIKSRPYPLYADLGTIPEYKDENANHNVKNDGLFDNCTATEHKSDLNNGKISTHKHESDDDVRSRAYKIGSTESSDYFSESNNDDESDVSDEKEDYFNDDDDES